MKTLKIKLFDLIVLVCLVLSVNNFLPSSFCDLPFQWHFRNTFCYTIRERFIYRIAFIPPYNSSTKLRQNGRAV
uniref:Putative secreted protein n=1 Tax=Anopheles triannulatus TaxID=58253 RepID=A0A2M4B3X6_9DIPT